MIIVDSSVWIDYFRKETSKGGKQLAQALLADDDVAILPIVLTEVLMGFKDDSFFRSAHNTLVKVPVVPTTLETHIEASKLFRKLQRQGVTVRGAIDCIIAQACIECSAELMTLDKDFVHIATHSALMLSSISFKS